MHVAWFSGNFHEKDDFTKSFVFSENFEEGFYDFGV